LDKKNERDNKKFDRLRKEQQRQDQFLHDAKMYSYEKLDHKIEDFIIRRNCAILFQDKLNDERYPTYKNFCENCGGLLNSKRRNWLIFSYPPPCNYQRNDILTCKVCFSFLAEEYFSNPVQTKRVYGEVQPDYNPEYLINEPFWEQPQKEYQFNFFSHLQTSPACY
jgi:hypothetical protein